MIFFVPEGCFILTNSADPDQMQYYAAFHLALHCSPKYPLRGFQYTKGLKQKKKTGEINVTIRNAQIDHWHLENNANDF